MVSTPAGYIGALGFSADLAAVSKRIGLPPCELRDNFDVGRFEARSKQCLHSSVGAPTRHPVYGRPKRSNARKMLRPVATRGAIDPQTRERQLKAGIIRIAALLAAAMVVVQAGAQTIPIGNNLPPEIAAAIKSAPLTQSLIPISGTEKFSQQIIKADEISFAEGSRLVLTNLNAPWVVVAARRIKFAKPESYSTLLRDPSIQSAAAGAVGTTGARGADHPGETGRRGNDGYPGGPGGPGGNGQTMKLPIVYLVVGDIRDPKGSVPPGLLSLVVNLRGVDGGDGGIGGAGGGGGNAGNGKEGAAGPFDCREGGGPGGTGGAAGPGGSGGNAGAGGNGADLVLVVTQKAYDVLSYARINNVGGAAGQPGRAGNPGKPGNGGAGAGSNGFCKATSPGASGGYPPASNSGAPAADGNKGSVTAAILPSVDPLFP